MAGNYDKYGNYDFSMGRNHGTQEKPLSLQRTPKRGICPCSSVGRAAPVWGVCRFESGKGQPLPRPRS